MMRKRSKHYMLKKLCYTGPKVVGSGVELARPQIQPLLYTTDVYACTHVCVYIYIYIYMFICIHMYIYIYMYRERGREREREIDR